MRTIKPNARFNSSHQNMMSAVIEFCLIKNRDVTQTIPAFMDIINLLKNNLEAAIVLEGKVHSPVTGVAVEKAAIKTSLVETSVIIMQTTYAYAKKNGLKEELAAKMRITSSKLLRMKDSLFTGTVAGAIEAVTKALPQLSAYNITDDVVNSWSEKLETFKNIASNPKTAQDGIDVFRNRIQDYLRENMILLYDQADAIVLQFKENNLSYYRGFRKARKIIPLVKHTKIHIAVTDEQGSVIPGVRVEQDNSTNYAITDVDGKADLYIQIPKPGAELKSVYTFTLLKDTIKMKTKEIVIKKGRSVTHKIVMKTNGYIIPELAAGNIKSSTNSNFYEYTNQNQAL